MMEEMDTRPKRIEMLEKSYVLHAICMVVRDEIEKKLTASLSQEEIEGFKAIYKRMLTNMEN